MAAICFYFQVHQPYRLRPFTIFDTDSNYFDEMQNMQVCRKVADKCYLPANRLLLEMIARHRGKFRVSYSITGIMLEQLEKYAPEALASFQELADTGCVEFLAETYHHSLSFLFSKTEFIDQVKMHMEAVKRYFGQTPRVFRNTELIYSNEVPEAVKRVGQFDAILAEGADHILGYRSPNFMYRSPGPDGTKLLLKNYRLSDDIAFRFSNRYWSEWPLKADKFASWVNAVNGNGTIVNLFMDYETFGEHQWDHTGIFHFLKELPEELLRHPDNRFLTCREAAEAFDSVDVIEVPHLTSWADSERDVSAWMGNPMQENALHELYQLEPFVRQTGDKDLLNDWRRLQISDHFYYMCTKHFSDGDVHKYFNPYESPYDSYINFMNVLDHLNSRCVSVCQRKEHAPARV
ncbi:MAG: glycoside hydrolase family 57 protein [Planctomycetaceae bacterium]|nr:glycoside hydrolase family 57 protein [Planctomycetaceae bacterium]